MKYKDAMNSSDAEEWRKEVKNEYERMRKLRLFKEVKRSELLKGVKPIDSTRIMKKESSGVYRGRITARGFKQVDDFDYNSTSICTPITNAASVRLILTLMAIMGGYQKW